MPGTRVIMVVATALMATACGSKGECEAIPEGEGRVQVGFWDNANCSGEPMITNSFPIEPDADCYCWPGNSGANSADSFACDPDAKTVTIVQYNSLTCGAGDDTPTTKTFHLNECKQDMPPTLFARVVDMGPCQ